MVIIGLLVPTYFNDFHNLTFGFYECLFQQFNITKINAVYLEEHHITRLKNVGQFPILFC